MDAWRIVSPNGKWDIIIIIGYSFPKTDMKSLLPFHVNWTNKTDFQLWWTISDVATAGHTMVQINDHCGDSSSMSFDHEFLQVLWM